MRKLLSLIVTCALCLPLLAQHKAPSTAPAIEQIQQAMQASADAWNRGDIRGFMDCYDRSPETTFVGSKVTHGWQAVLDNYLKKYTSAAAMGHLDFSELQIRPLDATTAVATGRFKLTRSRAGGGDASGIFSLAFVKRPQGWKIALDHTVSDQPASH